MLIFISSVVGSLVGTLLFLTIYLTVLNKEEERVEYLKSRVR